MKHPITTGLIAINVILFGLQYLTGEGLTMWGAKVCASAWLHGRPAKPCPFLLQSPAPGRAMIGTYYPHRRAAHTQQPSLLVPQVNSLIVAGQWWRFITPAFLHGNIMHLMVNAYSLNNLGTLVESSYGGPRYAIIYAIAAVAGNVASFYGSASPSLGASGVRACGCCVGGEGKHAPCHTERA